MLCDAMLNADRPARHEPAGLLSDTPLTPIMAMQITMRADDRSAGDFDRVVAFSSKRS
jgi:hypothetical protein